jgi:hypothetical protein
MDRLHVDFHGCVSLLGALVELTLRNRLLGLLEDLHDESLYHKLVLFVDVPSCDFRTLRFSSRPLRDLYSLCGVSDIH